MKILFLPAYFTPENMSSTPHDTNLQEDLANAGVEMVVYTPVPTRNVSERVRIEYQGKKLEKAYGGLMTIHRFNLPQEGRNPVCRAFRYFLQCLKQINRGLFYKDAKSCNVIYVDSTPPIQGAMAAVIKRFRHVPIVFKLGDVFPDSMVGAGLITPDSILYKIGKRIEKITYRNADRIIVVSDDIKTNLISKGVMPQKIEVVYDWVDTEKLYSVEKQDNPLFEKFGLDRDKFNVVYAGNLGSAQNISIIIEGAKKLSNKPIIQFVIFGNGDNEEEIKKLIEKSKLNNLKIFPLQPLDLVPYVYSIGDACIVSCKLGFGGKAMPSKTWSIMACGRPVIASFDRGELEEIIKRENMGCFCMAENVDSFVEKICYLENNREMCIEMGFNGRRYVENHLSRKYSTNKIISILRQANKSSISQ